MVLLPFVRRGVCRGEAAVERVSHPLAVAKAPVLPVGALLRRPP